jgi:hypothetical protein
LVVYVVDITLLNKLHINELGLSDYQQKQHHPLGREKEKGTHYKYGLLKRSINGYLQKRDIFKDIEFITLTP